MKPQNTIKTILLSLSKLLDEERESLRRVTFDNLQDINRRKTEALRRMDQSTNQLKGAHFNTDELEPYFDRVRVQARLNTQLLGSALNGAKSAADVLNYIQTGEPMNQTYTAFGVRRPLTGVKRKNNQLV